MNRQAQSYIFPLPYITIQCMMLGLEWFCFILISCTPWITVLQEVTNLQCQLWQVPYEVAPTMEPWHHAHDIVIDSQVIKLHDWLLDNVLLDLGIIECHKRLQKMVHSIWSPNRHLGKALCFLDSSRNSVKAAFCYLQIMDNFWICVESWPLCEPITNWLRSWVTPI